MKVNIGHIVELDRIGMSEILSEFGDDFDPVRRRNKISEEIDKGAEFITIYCSDKLVGYLEYMNKDLMEIEILSIQIHPLYRNGIILKNLLKKVLSVSGNFLNHKVKSGAHRNNSKSLLLHEKLGFVVESQNDNRIKFCIDGEVLSRNLKHILQAAGKM